MFRRVMPRYPGRFRTVPARGVTFKALPGETTGGADFGQTGFDYELITNLVCFRKSTQGTAREEKRSKRNGVSLVKALILLA
jgi:hypothetical protein